MLNIPLKSLVLFMTLVAAILGLSGCDASYSVEIEDDYVTLHYTSVPGHVSSDTHSFVDIDGYIVDSQGRFVDEDFMYFTHALLPDAYFQWQGFNYVVNLSQDIHAELVINDDYACFGDYILVLQLYTDRAYEIELPFHLSDESGCHAHFD